ncbi:MAG: hypothetical protein PHQ59_04920 [Candidatus Daviesbacteria bacterium]|nr:hypothetical protein [Candidatus Daviesbacteria bacterium]
MTSHSEFRKQLESDFKFRKKTYFFFSDYILIIIFLGALILFIGDIITKFSWLSGSAFLVGLVSIYNLIKREGYKEGYFEGGNDIGERAKYQIETNSDIMNKS